MEIPILYCLVSGSALTDLYRHKIFNKWLMICSVACFAAAMAGWSEELLWMKLIRAGVTLVLLLPVYKLGGLGGGDVKLFSVIALLLSGEELVSVIILSFVIGAVEGIIKILKNRSLNQTIHFALPMLISVLLVTGTHGRINF